MDYRYRHVYTGTRGGRVHLVLCRDDPLPCDRPHRELLMGLPLGGRHEPCSWVFSEASSLINRSCGPQIRQPCEAAKANSECTRSLPKTPAHVTFARSYACNPLTNRNRRSRNRDVVCAYCAVLAVCGMRCRQYAMRVTRIPESKRGRSYLLGAIDNNSTYDLPDETRPTCSP